MLLEPDPLSGVSIDTLKEDSRSSANTQLPKLSSTRRRILAMEVANLPGEEALLDFLEESLKGTPLPAPWKRKKDDSNRMFFVNESTGVATFKDPLDPPVRELASVCRMCASLPPQLREPCIQAMQQKWDQQAKGEFARWQSAVDPASGNTYYYHIETDATMWEDPSRIVLPGHYLKMKAVERLREEEVAFRLGGPPIDPPEIPSLTGGSLEVPKEIAEIATQVTRPSSREGGPVAPKEMAETSTQISNPVGMEVPKEIAEMATQVTRPPSREAGPAPPKEVAEMSTQISTPCGVVEVPKEIAEMATQVTRPSSREGNIMVPAEVVDMSTQVTRPPSRESGFTAINQVKQVREDGMPPGEATLTPGMVVNLSTKEIVQESMKVVEDSSSVVEEAATVVEDAAHPPPGSCQQSQAPGSDPGVPPQSTPPEGSLAASAASHEQGGSEEVAAAAAAPPAAAAPLAPPGPAADALATAAAAGAASGAVRLGEEVELATEVDTSTPVVGLGVQPPAPPAAQQRPQSAEAKLPSGAAVPAAGSAAASEPGESGGGGGVDHHAAAAAAQLVQAQLHPAAPSEEASEPITAGSLEQAQRSDVLSAGGEELSYASLSLSESVPLVHEVQGRSASNGYPSPPQAQAGPEAQAKRPPPPAPPALSPLQLRLQAEANQPPRQETAKGCAIHPRLLAASITRGRGDDDDDDNEEQERETFAKIQWWWGCAPLKLENPEAARRVYDFGRTSDSLFSSLRTAETTQSSFS